MNSHKLLRILTAIPLGIMAIIFLIFVPSAHVTMCMACAIGYSLGLPVDKYEKTLNKIVSFFGGGILFYTVYAGSTIMLLERLTGPGGRLLITDPAWIYHVFINFALLVMFITKKDRIEYVLGGIEAFMIGAPIMLVIQRLFGRELWGGISRMSLYVGIGLALLVVHQVVARYRPNLYARALLSTRKLIMISLIVYTILLIAIVPLDLIQRPDQNQDQIQWDKKEPKFNILPVRSEDTVNLTHRI